MARIIIAALLVFVALHRAGCQRISTVRVGDNRYFVSWHSPYSPRLNFHLAYEYCRTIAMELVSFETAEEAQLLTDFLRTTGSERNPVRDFWTSGNALGSDTWIWMSNGSPLNSTFNYWRNGAVPERTDGACLLHADSAQTWQPTNCAEAHHFICEQTRCYFYNFNPFQQNILASSSTNAPAATVSARTNTNAEDEEDEDDEDEVEEGRAAFARKLRFQNEDIDSLAIDLPSPAGQPHVFALPPAKMVPEANKRAFLFKRQEAFSVAGSPAMISPQ